MAEIIDGLNKLAKAIGSHPGLDVIRAEVGFYDERPEVHVTNGSFSNVFAGYVIQEAPHTAEYTHCSVLVDGVRIFALFTESELAALRGSSAELIQAS